MKCNECRNFDSGLCHSETKPDYPVRVNGEDMAGKCFMPKEKKEVKETTKKKTK